MSATLATVTVPSFSVPDAMQPIWSALVDDTNTAVSVLDADGLLMYANLLFARWCNRAASEVHGRHLRDLWAEDFARERLDLVREAAATGRTLVVDGMIRGRWVRTVLRPLAGDSSRRRVLMVCRVTAPGEHHEAPARANGENGAVRARVDDPGVLGSLTGREMEILKLIGGGMSTAQIAKKLHRSVKTVEWHRVSLGNKLGVSNRVELARIAISAGLVDLDASQAVMD